jgi:hypothetical protein
MSKRAMLADIISIAQQAKPKVIGHKDMALLTSKNQLTGFRLIKGGSTQDLALGGGGGVSNFFDAAT